MRRFGHLGGALLLASAVSVLFSLQFIWILWLCLGSVLLAVFPDEDVKWHGHRGFTHSILFLVLVTVGCSLIVSIVYLYLPKLLGPVVWSSLESIYLRLVFLTTASIGIGLGSHIFLDLLTHSGIPLFWPSQRRYSLRICQASNMYVNFAIMVLGLLAFFFVIVRI